MGPLPRGGRAERDAGAGTSSWLLGLLAPQTAWFGGDTHTCTHAHTHTPHTHARSRAPKHLLFLPVPEQTETGRCPSEGLCSSHKPRACGMSAQETTFSWRAVSSQSTGSPARGVGQIQHLLVLANMGPTYPLGRSLYLAPGASPEVPDFKYSFLLSALRCHRCL